MRRFARLFTALFLLAVLPVASAATKRSATGKRPTSTKTPAKSSREPVKKSAADDEEKAPPEKKPPVEKSAGHAPNASIEPTDLVEFSTQPARVQQLLTAALALTKQNLTYQYGSSDPAAGGMDCSGTIAYLLAGQGLKEVPRDSAGQYVWVRRAGGFRAVVGKLAKSFEFGELLPGDLLFWSGTYEVARDFPITHVMLYLGTEKRRKKRVMVGASDGRSYDGVQRWGVSVFDFDMPRSADAEHPEKAKVDFVGYGRIPGLRESVEAVAAASPNPAEASEPEKPAAPAKKPAPAKSGKSTRKRP